MTNAEKEEYLKKCTGCLSCKYFLGEDKYGWGHCLLKEKEKTMTNADKYLKEGVDIHQMATEMVDYFNFPPYEGIGESSIEEFFDKEVKPTLTEDERVILRNINEEKIGRLENGNLYATTPMLGNSGRNTYLRYFKHLFQFIKERRRI